MKLIKTKLSPVSVIYATRRWSVVNLRPTRVQATFAYRVRCNVRRNQRDEPWPVSAQKQLWGYRAGTVIIKPLLDQIGVLLVCSTILVLLELHQCAPGDITHRRFVVNGHKARLQRGSLRIYRSIIISEHQIHIVGQKRNVSRTLKALRFLGCNDSHRCPSNEPELFMNITSIFHLISILFKYGYLTRSSSGPISHSTQV